MDKFNIVFVFYRLDLIVINDGKANFYCLNIIPVTLCINRLSILSCLYKIKKSLDEGFSFVLNLNGIYIYAYFSTLYKNFFCIDSYAWDKLKDGLNLKLFVNKIILNLVFNKLNKQIRIDMFVYSEEKLKIRPFFAIIYENNTNSKFIFLFPFILLVDIMVYYEDKYL